MKLNVVVIFIFVVVRNSLALNSAQKAILKSKLQSSGFICLLWHRLSISDVEELSNYRMLDNETVRCYIECVLQEIGIMDDMAQLSASGARESAIKLFENSSRISRKRISRKVEDLVEKCSKVNKRENPSCKRAERAYNCLVKNAPRFGFDLDDF